MSMKRISLSEYRDLLKRSQLVEQDAHGEKVLIAQDGCFVKVFRNKKRFSTAAIKPYAVRFCENSQKLDQLQIPTVKVRSLVYCFENKRHLVTYQPISGKTLRDALGAGVSTDALLSRFAKFLARLHQNGIYFRSIHFGNVIVQPESESGEFGLIDLADMKFCPRSLNVLSRVRNFRHFFRYRKDAEFIESFGINRFIEIYLAKTTIFGWRRKIFLRLVDRVIGSVHPT